MAELTEYIRLKLTYEELNLVVKAMVIEKKHTLISEFAREKLMNEIRRFYDEEEKRIIEKIKSVPPESDELK